MADTSGFGAGFDDFLQAQGGSPNPQQVQQSPATAPGIGVVIPGQQPNPVQADNSGIDQGFLDFLSGQEAKSNVNQTPQPAPEVIPTVVPSQATPETQQANPEPMVSPTNTTATPPSADEQTEQTTSTTTSATPADEQQQPASTDASPQPVQNETLKEIKEKFGGRWKLVRSDPYDEYLKAVGIGLLNRQLAARGFPEQVFRVEGEQIYISTHTTFHSQNYIFKLNDETQNYVEKELQSVFCSYKDGKLILQMTPVNQGFAKVQEVQITINERGENVIIYTHGQNTCRRYFQRIMTVIC